MKKTIGVYRWTRKRDESAKWWQRLLGFGYYYHQEKIGDIEMELPTDEA
jgi:hypothetical protein